MSTYYIESKDKTLINFKEYDMCNEAGKEASRLAKESGLTILVYKTFKYPPTRDSSFLRSAWNPDGTVEFFSENQLDYLFDSIE